MLRPPRVSHFLLLLMLRVGLLALGMVFEVSVAVLATMAVMSAVMMAVVVVMITQSSLLL